MVDNKQSAKCSKAVYRAARAAGLLVVTSDDEAAIQRFAIAMYGEGYADATDSIAAGEAPRYAAIHELNA